MVFLPLSRSCPHRRNVLGLIVSNQLSIHRFSIRCNVLLDGGGESAFYYCRPNNPQRSPQSPSNVLSPSGWGWPECGHSPGSTSHHPSVDNQVLLLGVVEGAVLVYPKPSCIPKFFVSASIVEDGAGATLLYCLVTSWVWFLHIIDFI